MLMPTPSVHSHSIPMLTHPKAEVLCPHSSASQSPSMSKKPLMCPVTPMALRDAG